MVEQPQFRSFLPRFGTLVHVKAQLLSALVLHPWCRLPSDNQTDSESALEETSDGTERIGNEGGRKAEACRGSFPVYTGGTNGKQQEGLVVWPPGLASPHKHTQGSHQHGLSREARTLRQVNRLHPAGLRHTRLPVLCPAQTRSVVETCRNLDSLPPTVSSNN